jgi:hypothetical protein
VTESENTQVFVLGGYDGDVIFGDLWRLDLDLLQWNRIPAQASENIVFTSLALPSFSKTSYDMLSLSTGRLYPGQVLRIRIGFNADPDPAF